MGKFFFGLITGVIALLVYATVDAGKQAQELLIYITLTWGKYGIFLGVAVLIFLLLLTLTSSLFERIKTIRDAKKEAEDKYYQIIRQAEEEKAKKLQTIKEEILNFETERAKIVNEWSKVKAYEQRLNYKEELLNKKLQKILEENALLGDIIKKLKEDLKRKWSSHLKNIKQENPGKANRIAKKMRYYLEQIDKEIQNGR